MTPGPIDTFFEWLNTRPADARTAVAVDGDRLLTEAGFLGKATLTDQTGRTWQLVVFRGDDLTFRLAYHRARCASTWSGISEAGRAQGVGRSEDTASRRDAATCYAATCHSALAWTAGLASHPVASGDFSQATVELAKAITSIEKRLGIAVPDFQHADQLLDWYVSSGHHLLELDAARTQHHLGACDEKQLIADGQG